MFIKKSAYILFFTFLLCGFSSCIVNAPRYTTVEKVLALKVGQTREDVARILGTPPYNLILLTDSENTVLYKFRVTDRTTVPFFLKENNGKSIKGKYVNLMVTYDKNGLIKKIASCNDCDETIVEQKKLDVNKVITFMTVTLPIVLLFFGIKGLTH